MAWGREAQQGESRESVNGDRRSGYQKVEGVEDEAKREVLNNYVVAWCKGSLRGSFLVTNLKMVGFHSCSVMRIVGATFLLMFSNEEDRRAMLDRDNPIYVPAREVVPVVKTMSTEDMIMVIWDEWVGVVDRSEGTRSEHVDVMLCESMLGHLGMVQEVPKLPVALVMGGADGKSPVAVLELD
ncbi:hypothetical protein V6N13_051198 [Hibiscus sabdariffa]